MKRFRRKAQDRLEGGSRHPRLEPNRTHSPATAPDVEGSGWDLGEQTYVTDGASLFRVADFIRDPDGRELIVELEDCHTLELLVCPAGMLSQLRLQSVTPALGH